MYWEDDDRAINRLSYSTSLKTVNEPSYKPVFKIIKEMYDEDKESRLINVRNIRTPKKEVYIICKEPEVHVE